MKVNNIQYPHPVLSTYSDDVLDSSFHSELKNVETENNIYILKLYCYTDNIDLLKLIEEKKACFTVKIDCNKTRYRHFIKSFNRNFEVCEKASNLDGNVKVSFNIISTDYIEKYTNDNFHPDYEDSPFRIFKGDVLAIGDQFSFDADKKVDPLRILPSIFSIQPNNNNNSSIDIDTSDEKIIIKLNQNNFYRYGHLKNTSIFQPILSSMVIIPALTKVIDDIKNIIENDDNQDELSIMEELRWFRVIKSKFYEFGLNIYHIDAFTDSSLSLAQKIIGNPLNEAFKSLEEIDSQ